VYGTVEGRASIESIDEGMSKSDFSFKPHIDKKKGTPHPVNAVWYLFLIFSNNIHCNVFTDCESVNHSTRPSLFEIALVFYSNSFIDSTSRFLMGGSDGRLRIWDPDTRKLIVDFPTYPNEIAALDVSPSGTELHGDCLQH